MIIGNSKCKDISALHKTGNSRAGIARRTDAGRIGPAGLRPCIAADGSPIGACTAAA